jgi:hypothetical protein
MNNSCSVEDSLDICCGDDSSNSAEMNVEEIYEWNVQKKVLESILEHIRPLDLVLFSGKNILSKTIQLVEKKKFGLGTISHVGVVVNKDVLPHIRELKENRLYIWESTSSKNNWTGHIKDIHGHNRFGVQIRDLEHVIHRYLESQGRVYWGKLKNNPWKCKSLSYRERFRQKRDIILTMKDVENKYGNSSFNLSIIDLAASIFPSLRPLRSLKKKIKRIFKKKKSTQVPLFCSEFASIIYKNLKIMPEDTEPSNIVPVDFIRYNKEKNIKFMKKIVEIVLSDKID